MPVVVDRDVTARSHAAPDRAQRRRQGESRLRLSPPRADRTRRAVGADPGQEQRRCRGGRAPEAGGAGQLLHERVCQLRVGHLSRRDGGVGFGERRGGEEVSIGEARAGRECARAAQAHGRTGSPWDS